MTSPIITVFFVVLGLTLVLSLLVRFWAIKIGVVDYQDKERKRHPDDVPLLGGIAIFIAFFVGLWLIRDLLVAGDLDHQHWIGFFIGSCFLIMGGFLDDKYDLPPTTQIIFPILAIISILYGGVEIARISSPLGGYIQLDVLKTEIMPGVNISLLSSILISFWLLGMMFTTKLLDGVDGLVTGVVGVGALITAIFTLTSVYYQPDIAYASIMLLATCLGFLILNWHPAKIFLGESGSMFLGFALGVLSIISGGKIAIALLVMGIPIMDVAWTIVQRLRAGQNPFTFADRRHLHFRLQDLGLSPRQTALIYYFLSGIFGISALFLQSQGKMMALGALVLVMFLILLIIRKREKKIV
jgi:UDP-GlcNAc:undecaprenyl-phosphate GlcNAc-1-phosphate transferase